MHRSFAQFASAQLASRIACALAAASAGSAAAQTFTWNDPAGGLWSSPSDWSPFGVPNDLSESATIGITGSYEVSIASADIEIGGFDIPNQRAVVRIEPGRTLTTHDPFVGIDGTLAIGDPDETSPDVATWLIATDTQLLGNGTIQLDLRQAGITHPNAAFAVIGSDVLGANTLTIGPDITVQGRGSLRVSIVNNGLIEAADDEDARIFIDFGATNSMTNTGTIAARDGASVQLDSNVAGEIIVTQTGAGQLLADGGTIAINTGVTGGVLRTINDGVITGLNKGSITQCTLDGRFESNRDDFTIASPGFTNNGTLAPTFDLDDPGFESVRIDGSVVIDGTGTIEFVGGFNDSEIPILDRLSGPGDQLVLRQGQTLIGRGGIEVDTTVEGTINMGFEGTGTSVDELGQLHLDDCTLALTATSTFRSQVRNDFTTSNDRIEKGFNASNTTILLAGTLLVEEHDGMGLEVGESLDIIELDSVVGTFDTEILPAGYSVSYSSTAVTLTRGSAPCACDVNADTLCNGSDFFAWVSAFGGQAPECDVNGDAACDGSDFFAWVAAFGQGC